jgi:hypothetical protein
VLLSTFELVQGGACSSAVAAGATANCLTSSNPEDFMVTSPLQTMCLGNTFNAQCPANNNNNLQKAMPVPNGDVKPVRCQACAISASADKEPTEGQYWVELAWGRNIVHSPTPNVAAGFSEQFTGYKIYIVDANGYWVETIKTTDSQASTVDMKIPVKSESMLTKPACCHSMEYKKTVKGTWPAGGAMFAIVPYHDVSDTVSFTMPIGTYSTAFVDNKAGTATKVVMAVTMALATEAEATAFITHPNAKDIMAESLAASLEGIDSSMIYILKLSVVTRRRLAAARRLAASVKCDYEILLPSDYSGEAITASSVSGDALKTAVQTKAAAAGVPVTVATVTSAEPVSSSVGTDDTPVTGAAQPMAGSVLSAMLAIAMVLAGRQFLE